MNKKDFKIRLSYDWFFYILVILLSVGVWVFSFNVYHAPKNYEAITLFFGGSVKDYKFEDDAKKAIDIRSVSIASSNPHDMSFLNKYSVVGLNSSDVVFVPNEIAEKTSCKGVFKELDESYGFSYFVQEEKKYGITINEDVKNKLSTYFEFEEKEYSLFVAEKSVNSGSITNKNFDLIKWMVSL